MHRLTIQTATQHEPPPLIASANMAAYSLAHQVTQCENRVMAGIGKMCQ